MLKSLKRKLALRRHPDLDPQWQVSKGHPEALPLREELFWFVLPIADMDFGARQKAQPEITEFFWSDLQQAGSDLQALASYTGRACQDTARLALEGIARKAAATGTPTTKDVHEHSLGLFAELACADDYGLRKTVADSLPVMLRVPALRTGALDIAIAQVGDHNYYVGEAAREAIVDMPDAANGVQRLIETGSDTARSRAPHAILQLARMRPDAVSRSLLDASTGLLTDERVAIRYIAATAFFELIDELPARAAQLQVALQENLESIFPSFVQEFADRKSGWHPSTIAAQMATFCQAVEPALDRVVELLDDSRAEVREGAARTICKLGDLDKDSLRSLEELQRTEPNWNTRLWMAAAIEAVTAEVLPMKRWPEVPAIPQMVFFESENHDAIPAGVRFEEGNPLRGQLKHEGGHRYLYWPDDHGVTSSDRLLDDYTPLNLEGDIPDLGDVEVDVTGHYRRHRISVESMRPNKRRQRRRVGVSE